MNKGTAITRFLMVMMPAGFEQHENIIYRKAFSLYLRGLLIERTLYKDTRFFREMILPFNRTIDFVTLNYCERLPSPLGSEFYFGSPREIADQMQVVIIERKLIKHVESPYGPSDFLATYGRVDIGMTPIWRAFDIGCAAALTGDLGLAWACLDRVKRDWAPVLESETPVEPNHIAFMRDIDSARDALGRGHAAIRAHLRERCFHNAAALGFQAAEP